MVRPCFYPKCQGDPAYVSLSVLENLPNLGRAYRPVRPIQCSHRAVLPVDRLLAARPMESSASRGGARVPRARATRQDRHGRFAGSKTSGTCRAPQRQIVHQKSHDRRAIPMGLLDFDDGAPRHERSASVAYRLRPPCWPRRATSRSIHLEPLTDLGHIGKPEPQ